MTIIEYLLKAKEIGFNWAEQAINEALSHNAVCESFNKTGKCVDDCLAQHQEQSCILNKEVASIKDALKEISVYDDNGYWSTVIDSLTNEDLTTCVGQKLTVKQFIQEVYYDKYGSKIFRRSDNQLICDVRGWGAIQYLEVPDNRAFLDEMGCFICDAINEKLLRDS